MEMSQQAQAAVKKMFSLHTAYATKSLQANLILGLTTLTVAIAPVYLAFTEGSPSRLFWWLLYPAMIIIQQYYRQRRSPNLYAWLFVHVVTWFIIYSISGGPSWFIWVYAGLLAGNHMFFIDMALIQHQKDQLRATPEWKEAEEWMERNEQSN